jgi:hypothetical protein
MPRHCKQPRPNSASSPPDREAVLDSLAAALAAVEASPMRARGAIRWTPDADAVIRAACTKGLPAARTAEIVGGLLGRRVGRTAVQDRARALGIA